MKVVAEITEIPVAVVLEFDVSTIVMVAGEAVMGGWMMDTLTAILVGVRLGVFCNFVAD